jgi:hypothetical protein
MSAFHLASSGIAGVSPFAGGFDAPGFGVSPEPTGACGVVAGDDGGAGAGAGADAVEVVLVGEVRGVFVDVFVDVLAEVDSDSESVPASPGASWLPATCRGPEKVPRSAVSLVSRSVWLV